MPQEYKLIDAGTGDHTCTAHQVQKLVDLYNDPNWEVDAVATDQMKFTCKVCQSWRVYKILPERTLL